MTEDHQKQLIEGLLSGDREGVRLFFREYGGIIRKAVDSVGIKDRAISSDDLFMAAVENLLQNDMKAVRSFKGYSKFSTYLYTICRRHALSLAGPPFPPGTMEEFTDNIPAGICDEIGIFDERRKKALAKAIRQCDAKLQIFIRMMFFEEKSTDEIREFFGWNSDNTVFSKKNKVIARLRKMVRRLLLRDNGDLDE
jgi:DNA-directed RNA polymerase specialized sigma24 family protein